MVAKEALTVGYNGCKTGYFLITGAYQQSPSGELKPIAVAEISKRNPPGSGGLIKSYN